ncbi:ABC transporter ATP-binding protein [Evtepia sp.]
MKIEIKNYTKVLKGATILDRVNLVLEGGTIYGFIGRNGSGKTMLLRAIAGLIRPTEGQVILDGEKELHKDSDFPPNMGVLLERPNFLNYLSGMDNLKMLAEIQGKIGEAEIAQWLQRFQMDPTDKKIFKHYSLGMKQKIGVIQALMEDQTLIVLDEPFNALDEEAVQVLREILLERKAAGNLIMLTSHHKEDIEALCDVVYRIDQGKVMPAE